MQVLIQVTGYRSIDNYIIIADSFPDDRAVVIAYGSCWIFQLGKFYIVNGKVVDNQSCGTG